jgi:hypothetical protein
MRVLITATLAPEAKKELNTQSLGILSSEWRSIVGEVKGLTFSDVETKFIDGLIRDNLHKITLEVDILDEGSMTRREGVKLARVIVTRLDSAILNSQVMLLPVGTYGIYVYMLLGAFGVARR